MRLRVRGELHWDDVLASVVRGGVGGEALVPVLLRLLALG